MKPTSTHPTFTHSTLSSRPGTKGPMVAAVAAFHAAYCAARHDTMHAFCCVPVPTPMYESAPTDTMRIGARPSREASTVRSWSGRFGAPVGMCRITSRRFRFAALRASASGDVYVDGVVLSFRSSYGAPRGECGAVAGTGCGSARKDGREPSRRSICRCSSVCSGLPCLCKLMYLRMRVCVCSVCRV